MKSSTGKLAGVFLMFVSAALCLGAVPAVALEISIEVSPSVLNLQSNGTVVTVHTDIDYSRVSVFSVFLNGVAIKSWKVDSRGDFVAKFPMEAVKRLDGLVIGDYNPLQLVGVTTDGEPFVGEQNVMVIDVVPQTR